MLCPVYEFLLAFSGEKVLTVEASDPDLDAELEYTIVGVRAADKTGVALKDTNIYNFKQAFRLMTSLSI